jgi:hypothetical protein
MTWTVVDNLILRKRDKWYRPSMRQALQGLHEFFVWIEQNLDRIDTKEPERKLTGTEDCQEHRGRDDCKRIMREVLEFKRSMVLS